MLSYTFEIIIFGLDLTVGEQSDLALQEVTVVFAFKLVVGLSCVHGHAHIPASTD